MVVVAPRPGWLRLFAQASPDSRLNSIPHLLAQKFPARTFVVETQVELTAAHAGDEAGLAVVGREEAAIALVRDGAGGQIICRSARRMDWRQGQPLLLANCSGRWARGF